MLYLSGVALRESHQRLDKEDWCVGHSASQGVLWSRCSMCELGMGASVLGVHLVLAFLCCQLVHKKQSHGMQQHVSENRHTCATPCA